MRTMLLRSCEHFILDQPAWWARRTKHQGVSPATTNNRGSHKVVIPASVVRTSFTLGH